MDKTDYGISITQSGVPIKLAPDYRKTIDSRWKFLEVEKESETNLELPYIAPDGSGAHAGFLRFGTPVMIMQHKLGFFPLFEVSAKPSIADPTDNMDHYEIYADEVGIWFIPRYLSGDGQIVRSYNIKYRVYNLNVTQEYKAPTATALGSGSGASDIGAKFIDDSGKSVSRAASTGFSMDTTKKTLSIHQITTRTINSGNPDVEHDVGYPPSYLIIRAPYEVFENVLITVPDGFKTKVLVEPLYNDLDSRSPVYFARVTATNTYVRFLGVQSTFEGIFTIIILKDPLEIAG